MPEDLFKNPSSKAPEEMWRTDSPLERQLAAAELWAELTEKKPEVPPEEPEKNAAAPPAEAVKGLNRAQKVFLAGTAVKGVGTGGYLLYRHKKKEAAVAPPPTAMDRVSGAGYGMAGGGLLGSAAGGLVGGLSTRSMAGARVGAHIGGGAGSVLGGIRGAVGAKNRRHRMEQMRAKWRKGRSAPLSGALSKDASFLAKAALPTATAAAGLAAGHMVGRKKGRNEGLRVGYVAGGRRGMRLGSRQGFQMGLTAGRRGVEKQASARDVIGAAMAHPKTLLGGAVGTLGAGYALHGVSKDKRGGTKTQQRLREALAIQGLKEERGAKPSKLKTALLKKRLQLADWEAKHPAAAVLRGAATGTAIGAGAGHLQVIPKAVR
tara:strand:+ start:390 stop:1517 length:1128 start_codon:yes stop_codon:yes gene_type:complete